MDEPKPQTFNLEVTVAMLTSVLNAPYKRKKLNRKKTRLRRYAAYQTAQQMNLQRSTMKTLVTLSYDTPGRLYVYEPNNQETTSLA